MDLFKIFTNITTANHIIAEIMDDVNDEEEEKGPCRGSRSDGGPNVDRESSKLEAILYRQYFSAEPIYDKVSFCHRFRVRKTMLDNLLHAVITHNPYFTMRKD